MSGPVTLAPTEALELDAVLERYPVLRQSILAKFDDCPLSAFFDMKYSNGWTTHPQARGTMFHRVAAECFREMRRNDSTTIPVGTALATLEELLEQRGVEPADRVRVPFREMPELRMAVAKFARDNSFSIRHVVDVENRIEADLTYVDNDGVKRTRTLSGQLDVLVADPKTPEGAIVIDWKDTWKPPPDHSDNPSDDGRKGLSYHGYFQQRFYGWLVMRNYPSIDVVTLREFYPRKTVARKASITRAQLEQVEGELATLVKALDECLASGPPAGFRWDQVPPWNPQPGAHCRWCLNKLSCPIPEDIRSQNFAVASESEARRRTATLNVIEEARSSLREALRPWVEANGPVYVRHSKGRRVFGLRPPKQGKGAGDLCFFTPEGADRYPTREAEDRRLEEAMKRSVEQARAERDAEPE